MSSCMGVRRRISSIEDNGVYAWGNFTVMAKGARELTRRSSCDILMLLAMAEPTWQTTGWRRRRQPGPACAKRADATGRRTSVD
eukprot:5778769-Pyramimonas_sp.AAC.1